MIPVLDDDILQWFREQVYKAGGGSYQTLINEDTFRHVLREELPRYGVQRKTSPTRRIAP